MSPQSLPRIAVCGAGAFGINHVKIHHQLGTLAAVVEPNESARAKLTSLGIRVPTHATIEPVLADPSIAGIVLATPAQLHFAGALRALQAGKHVLIEKPMTLDSLLCASLVKEAHDRRLVILVGHIPLYHPLIQWAKSMILDGRIGDIWRITATRTKLGRVRTHENVFWSFAPHDLAVALHLTEIEAIEPTVWAHGLYRYQPTIADEVLANFQFPRENLSIQILASWCHPDVVRVTRVFGTTGMIKIDEVSGIATLWVGGIDEHLQETLREVDYFSLSERCNPLEDEAKDFLSAIQTGHPVRSDGRLGMRVVRMLEHVDKALITQSQEAIHVH